MEGRYDDAEAERMVSDLAAKGTPEPLALRTYTARLLGAEASLVLHGGGNTSVKSEARTLLGERVAVLHVKGSGWDLATIQPAGHPAVRMAPLLAYRALRSLSDEDMVNALRLALLDAGAPTPSVETLLHAYLPARFIDHTHADAVLALADQPNGEAVCREAIDPHLVWVPYVMPGFALAQRCAAAYDAAAALAADRGEARPTVIVLERHGIFTLGETAKESYERMIAAVSRAEAFVLERERHDDTRSRITPVTPASAAPLARLLLPALRGALAHLSGAPPERGPLLDLRTSDRILRFLERDDAEALSQVGCATPDHVLRTKPVPLFFQPPVTEDPAGLRDAFTQAIGKYAEAYADYFSEMTREKRVKRTMLDPFPRIVLVPGLGLISAGTTAREAGIAADVYEHTIEVLVGASAVGRYTPVSRGDLFDVEYWSLEQAKLKPVARTALGGAIALVTGAASGIGYATAKRFLDLGAHVTLVDRDAPALDDAVHALASGRRERVVHVRADVTSFDDVTRAVATTVRTFGGLDVVVSNAGVAPEGGLHTEQGVLALGRSLDVNLLAHNHVARAAAAVFEAQGVGGCLLFNASKSAFNPGPGFGPYAVAKAALVALMRQYAVDLGSAGVRANAVNADRIRTSLFGNGVAESRAAARKVSVDDYFRANLLGREVTADDVAGSFAYLAEARATTGCVVTVDGGNAAAFPR